MALRLLADVDSSFSRNCCWQLRRRTLALGIGADADGGFAWSGRRWCRRRSRAASYRVIANDRKFRSTVSGRAALTIMSALTRAREGAAPIPTRSDADRPAPAGSVALRLLADVDSSFSRNCCWQLRRRTLALGIGADADGGFAWSGRRWCRRRSRAASYRVIANDRKFRSTVSGLDLPGPRSGCWPHDGEVAGGAVANSTLVIFRFGATMELGRSERTTMRPLWSYGVDGADTPDRKPR